uniref:ADAMTS like 3 n=1 Tax=Malurus cyaneus samueli TaxID=2593467 RepID=A0A8C5TTI0_9PASS
MCKLLPGSRTTRSDEDKDDSWDAWGAWSDCSRTCGGGASYSLRRCLNGRNCEGRNIRYKTCSSNDCPSDVGDFRAQQCSAYNDVKFQGQLYEWVPVYNHPAAPCALKCQALGKNLIVELAPKVLDGTRCNSESLDMCISGICQVWAWVIQTGTLLWSGNVILFISSFICRHCQMDFPFQETQNFLTDLGIDTFYTDKRSTKFMHSSM